METLGAGVSAKHPQDAHTAMIKSLKRTLNLLYQLLSHQILNKKI